MHQGEPHTLEHLIFLGSEEYPYKGVLDQIANRCLARGTNAWTSSDHTAYTLNCVGSCCQAHCGGFLGGEGGGEEQRTMRIQ